MTEEEADKAFLNWLASNGPREWHQVAISWNWDAGYEILDWLIEQKTLDRGTAVSLFFVASPDYFLKYSSRDAMMAESPWEQENFDFLTRLLHLASLPDYYKSEHFRCTEFVTQDLIDEYVSKQNALPAEKRPWTAPEKLLSVVRGETVNVDDFIEGYPQHIWNTVDEGLG